MTTPNATSATFVTTEIIACGGAQRALPRTTPGWQALLVPDCEERSPEECPNCGATPIGGGWVVTVGCAKNGAALREDRTCPDCGTSFWDDTSDCR